MGLGFQGKKVEAIWPLTSDFLIPASIQGPIKQPLAPSGSQNPKLHMEGANGIRFPGEKQD